MTSLPAFKAYDIRGRIPDELNADLAYRIGMAYAARFHPRRMVVGRDMRLSSPEIADALSNGLQDAGVDVVDIGLGGTELVYFAAFHLADAAQPVDGGIAVTASHNPKDYNGMKLVTRGAVPVSGDSGLRDIESLAAGPVPARAATRGQRTAVDIWDAYVAHLLSYVDLSALVPLKIVANAGNGCAGLVVERLVRNGALPFTFDVMHGAPDGTFPHGVPNPLLPENRAETVARIKATGADLGIAWDGDHDRCFFFDEQGDWVSGYALVGLLAREALRSAPPGARIIHDPRLMWNTVDVVTRAGGVPVMCKTGHAFIKERMRKEDAIYGGEISAHHYFQRFGFCDSGMIPWLLVTAALSAQVRAGKKPSLRALVQDMARAYPHSEEENLHLKDAKAALGAVRAFLASETQTVDETDGLSLECRTASGGAYRVNVRASNTEPVVRVNVEARGDAALMQTKLDAVLSLLRKGG